jgi:peptide/nickel transport system permease protein
MVRHVLPNAAPALIAQGTSFLVMAVTAEATLSFLGLGIPAPFPSWGRMLLEGARQYLESAPWITAFPALALLLTVASIAMLGDAVRDIAHARVAAR